MITVTEKYQIKEEMIDYSLWERNSKGKLIHKGYYKDLSDVVRAILKREAHNSSMNVLIDLEQALTRLEGIEKRYIELAETLAKELEHEKKRH